MSSLQSDSRAATVEMLTDFASATNRRLQVYPGRPATIMPPTAFVDRMSEVLTYTGLIRERRVTTEAVLIHGLFDTKDAVEQKDAFADEFADWVNQLPNFHAAGGNTSIAVLRVEDEPNYIPDWLRPEDQRSFYASRISLESRVGGS